MSKVPSGLLIILVSCGLLFNNSIGRANAQVPEMAVGKLSRMSSSFGMRGKHNNNVSRISKNVSLQTEIIKGGEFLFGKIFHSLKKTIGLPDQEEPKPPKFTYSYPCKSDEADEPFSLKDEKECKQLQSTKQNREKQDVQGTHLIIGGAAAIGGTVVTCTVTNCNPGDNNLQNFSDRKLTTISSGAKSNGTKKSDRKKDIEAQ